MKKLINVISLVCIISLFAGCASTGSRQPIDYAPAVKQAAKEGTNLVVAEHPDWRQHFLDASDELNIIANAPNINFQTVIDIVNRLPVKELKSKDAKLAISGARIVLSFVQVEVPLDKVEKYRPIVVALRDGIQEGLQ
jgi:hypothetical protein